MKNLRDLASALKVTKMLAANAVDGKIVGVDSVSGSNYFQDNLSVGSIYVDTNGVHKVIVDAIAYPKHKGVSGKAYNSAVRFVAISFDKDTLELGPLRCNIGYDQLEKHAKAGRVLSIDIWSYVLVIEKNIADAAAAKLKAETAKKLAEAEKARKLAEAERIARMQTSLNVRNAIGRF